MIMVYMTMIIYDKSNTHKHEYIFTHEYINGSISVYVCMTMLIYDYANI